MFTGAISAFLLTPLFVFPSFGGWADGSFSFSAPRAEAQEREVDRGSWRDRWNDRWNEERPHIDDIDPASGDAGTEVTLSGENFEDDSSVRFGRETIDDVDVSDDGTELMFTVPDTVNDRDLRERSYPVRVQNDFRTSNAVRFEVILQDDDDDDDGSDELSIESIDGPTALDIGEEGTWTVDVDGEFDGNLNYSVKWGDEPVMARLFATEDGDTQFSATFTHTYHDEGTYMPEFTVTDEDGTSVSKAAAEVTVGDDDNNDDAAPQVDAIDPASAEAGETVTLTGSGFDADSNVFLSGTEANDVKVVSDTEITFTVPELDEGDYRVVVRDDDGRSTAVRLTIEADADVEGRISVNGISAPSRLTVGEDGTWTVDAATNLDGNLTYSVDWGDEPMMARLMSANDEMTQSSATFTHAYQEAGTYTPEFTVTDEEGNSAKVSATVVVDDADDEGDDEDEA